MHDIDNTHATDREPVARRSHRLRRGVLALGIAVAMPAAFTTSPASAWIEPVVPIEQGGELCYHDGKAYSHGAVVAQGKNQVEKTCHYGVWK